MIRSRRVVRIRGEYFGVMKRRVVVKGFLVVVIRRNVVRSRVRARINKQVNK